ncbi:MAG: hypothetical protein ACRD50_00485 [Candidatus Acidiferrales bacterium]
MHAARNSQSRERGAARLKTLLSLLILAAIVIFLIKIVPIYYDNYVFTDTMINDTQAAVRMRQSEEDVRDAIYKAMKENDIPGTRDTIRITVGGGAVTVALDYTVPVDLYFYQFNLNFHPQCNSNSIFK